MKMSLWWKEIKGSGKGSAPWREYEDFLGIIIMEHTKRQGSRKRELKAARGVGELWERVR